MFTSKTNNVTRFNIVRFPEKKGNNHVQSGENRVDEKTDSMVKFLKPIDKHLLLVLIYLEIGFCGKFESEKQFKQ